MDARPQGSITKPSGIGDAVSILHERDPTDTVFCLRRRRDRSVSAAGGHDSGGFLPPTAKGRPTAGHSLAKPAFRESTVAGGIARQRTRAGIKNNRGRPVAGTERNQPRCSSGVRHGLASARGTRSPASQAPNATDPVRSSPRSAGRGGDHGRSLVGNQRVVFLSSRFPRVDPAFKRVRTTVLSSQRDGPVKIPMLPLERNRSVRTGL